MVRYVTPVHGQRTATTGRAESGTPVPFYPSRPTWVKEWIENQVRWGLLVCGHFFDRNDRTGILVGDKVLCDECGCAVTILRPSTLLERFGIVPAKHLEPPF